MLFDITIVRDGKTKQVRGNQKYLDQLAEEGCQIIDRLPIVSHRPTLPRDSDEEVDSDLFSHSVISEL